MQSQQFRESLKKEHIHVSDKDVNWFIHELEPKQNSREDYQKALAIWNEYLIKRKSQVKQANSILAGNTKISRMSVGSNLCQLCYNQFSRKRQWCQNCGTECCEKCVARLRVIKNQEPSIFCEKCDKQYMVAMIIKQDEQNFVLRQKAFTTLADEQQMIESLLKIQKHKLITNQQKEGECKNILLKKMNEITELSSANQMLRGQISQVNKKIQWGYDIKTHLIKKLKKYKKNQTHSFSSSFHESHQAWAPPQADVDEYVSVENLNESIINSLLQHQVQKTNPKIQKCTCQIF